MVRKSTREELVTEQDKPKPIKMVPMPDNLGDMTDEQIEEFAKKIYDGWVKETLSEEQS